MSATRDKSQKITFVYSNLYSIYRHGVERARLGAIRESDESSPSRAAEALKELAVGTPAGKPVVPQAFESGVVIKASQAQAQARPQARPAPRVTSYTPAELIGKKVARPAAIAGQKPAQSEGVQSLKKNLENLNDLQARLRFMLKELEDLIKE